MLSAIVNGVNCSDDVSSKDILMFAEIFDFFSSKFWAC